MVNLKSIVAALFLTFAQGCGNTYNNKTLEEVVSTVKTVKEATLGFIGEQINYAYEDTDQGIILPFSDSPMPSNRLPPALNGAEIQSFRLTFERGRGVCRDGAIAVAAMLQDDNFPSFYLSLGYCSDKPGHAVFPFQNDKKMWGSGGINASDYKEPTHTLEELAREIVSDHEEELCELSLYDLSGINLVEGTNNGRVLIGPFLIYRSTADSEFFCTTRKQDGNYLSNCDISNREGTLLRTSFIIYSINFFEEYGERMDHNTGHRVVWNVLERSARCQNPTKSERKYYNGEELMDWTLTTTSYLDTCQENVSNMDILNDSGEVTATKTFFYQYHRKSLDSPLSLQTISSDNDHDGFYDHIIQMLYDLEGNLLTTNFDTNGDGTWDIIRDN